MLHCTGTSRGGKSFDIQVCSCLAMRQRGPPMTFMFSDADSSSSAGAAASGGEIVQLHPLRVPHTRGGVVRRVALIGTFAPRQCGIATFTSDVFEQLGTYHPEIALEVYALDDGRKPLAYDNVRQVIAASQPESYLQAARSINA